MVRRLALIILLTLAAGDGFGQDFGISFSAGMIKNDVWGFTRDPGHLRGNYLFDLGMYYNLVPAKTITDFSGPLQLSLTTGYHRWMDPSLQFYYSYTPQFYYPYGLMAQPLTIRQAVDIPLLVGIRWQVTNSIFSPYLSFEMGPHYIQRDHQIVQWDTPPPRSAGSVVSSRIETESVVRLGFRIGAGATVRLEDRLHLDFGFKYNSILWNYEYDGLAGNWTNAITNFDFSLGLRFGLSH